MIRNCMSSLRGRALCLIIFILLLNEAIIQTQAQHSSRREKNRNESTRKYPARVHPCEHSSCYPATGNLLIGRENRLYASSTCGVKQAERFCIVSHLEEKKCFLCDTRSSTWEDHLKNHRIGQIIQTTKPGTRNPTWWQSENGKENVTIQLDLEAEFHFTHLIIVFATFRPAAMLIERSYDFGKTWQVYRYFAHNCPESFPGVPTAFKNITDVVCDNRYSSVEPSKNGEVIFRVLPPNMKVENPYAQHVQNMLKMTNLRINFTRLHNLGDTLLDDRQEIQEKYYYAISNMVVRGSCSCYGHASRCLPLEGSNNNDYDMVHGRCECTHNTKGLNCEECEDFFNDLPWKPALGKQTNACKKCNCNNHATSCHFDEAVYDQSGKISGGVCDNCQHNTHGQHCEECVAFFYKDPIEDIQSPYICKPCDCDPVGALDDGICDSVNDPENGVEAGACHCKTNVKGRRCDMCKDGYWNLETDNPDGCEACTCNTYGTVDNSGCNMHTGECTCKRLVTGKDCNQCLPETFGLSDSHDGCSPCNCDIGGAYDNYCDVITGQCRCRSHMTGRTCGTPLQNYFIPSLHIVFDAETADITECITLSNNGNCTRVPYQPPVDRNPDFTGPGYIRVPEESELYITADNIPKTMAYDVVIRYQVQTRGNWEDALITLIRPEDVDPNGECSNSHPSYETRVQFSLPEYQRYVVALRDICLEQNKVYKFRIHFERHRHNEDNPVAQILIDSLTLIPRIEVTELFNGSQNADNRLKEYERLGCKHIVYTGQFDSQTQQDCKDLLHTASTYINNGASQCNCHPTGALSKQCDDHGGHCQCKPNVVARQCDQCATGTYGFGPEGCKACDCNSIGSKDNNCDLITGQCSCLPNTYGRECDQCQPGYWNFPNCQMCQCNGHAQGCDSRTGQCLNCLDYTTGYNCDICLDGFYGNPYLGSEIGCRPCRCPDTIASGNSHADACELRQNNMACLCKEGYSGTRCEVCADNFFGNPDEPGGSCSPCNCSNNVDPYAIGNCDGKTGKCLRCMYETTGEHCEICQDGYHGNALIRNCMQCVCDVLGTNSTVQHCDRYTGQCPCLRNVQGKRCDECIENHWKIASGEGCEPCDCDTIGSDSDQCNTYDGQCQCRPGFGGRQCDQCQTGFWGDPNRECHACNCDHHGSADYQCDRETGQCVCHEGIGGYKCNECARGYLGIAPYCSPCGECFNNWDIILSALDNSSQETIQRAKQIKTIGATGAYTADFSSLENKLKSIRQLLDNTTVSMQDISQLDQEALNLKKQLKDSHTKLTDSELNLEKIYSDLSLSTVELERLRNQNEAVKQLSKKLKENGIELQESNIEGALNLTRNAYNRVNLLSNIKNEVQENSLNTERQCKRIETLTNKIKDEVSPVLLRNKDSITDYRNQLANLSAAIPDLNNEVCDKRGNPCDNLCGGAGCGSCGGLSCEKGALTRTEKALKVAKDTEAEIRTKKETADSTIRSLFQAKQNASDAHNKAKDAYEDAERFLNTTKSEVNVGVEITTKFNTFINNNTALPAESLELAKKTLKLDLKLEPEEINKLGYQINAAVASLDDVEKINSDTRSDLQRVHNLKKNANATKEQADKILDIANSVVKSLEEADKSQLKAQEAIKLANSNIELAAKDLEKIDHETSEAELPANQTAVKVENLAKKVNRLHKNILKNDIDAKDVKAKAISVKELANNSLDRTKKLKIEAENANESLTDRAKTSEKARDRAKALLQRASKLTVDTNEKLRELQGMQETYNQKDDTLSKLKNLLDPLSEELSTYLTNIQIQAERYRQCT